MNTVDRLASALRAQLAEAPEPIAVAYLFGSVARGDDTPSSDIDLGVLLAQPPEPTLDGRLLRLEASLERQLGRPVQAVVLNDSPPDLVHRVLRDGIIVCEKDRSARIAFEVRSRNEYFDLLPVIQRYRETVLRRLHRVPAS